MIPLPDPPLADGAVRLRRWTVADAPALAAAWADPEIQRWTGVPAVRDTAAAGRWIAGEEVRRQRNLALDLVVSPADPGDAAVLGEVGMVPLAGGPSRAELGWWIGSEHRGGGIATRAVVLLVSWLRTELGLTDLVASVDVANPASVRVAEAAGLRLCRP
jgi:RimJ/RimL family protein N-acetyltransferase